jgi:hypothetical protein
MISPGSLVVQQEPGSRIARAATAIFAMSAPSGPLAAGRSGDQIATFDARRRPSVVSLPTTDIAWVPVTAEISPRVRRCR